MRDSLKRIFVLSGRNLKEILRDPLSLIFMMAMPLGMEVLFYFIFHNMTDQFEMKYLAPGIAVFSQAFLCLFSGLLISLDRASSFLTRLFVSRTKAFEFIFAYALALMPVSLVQSVLFFLVGGIIDPGIISLSVLKCLGLCLVTSLFFIGMGIFLGSLCNEKAIGGVSSIVIVGQSVLSGMWFPVEGLGGGMMALMNALPFRNATLLVQNALNGWGDLWGDMLRPLIILLAYTVAAFILAVLAFRRNMKRL